jgi:hypothetical protein
MNDEERSMRTFVRWGVAGMLLAVGYGFGASGVLTPGSARAQPAAGAAPESGVTDLTLEKLKATYNALQAAGQALQEEGRYVPATTGNNAFAISVGGVNAIEDLETGRGVDPETFAGLYAGRALEEVARNLGRDSEGRLTYKNRIVRIYPISRLQQLYAERDRLAGLEPSP